MPKMKTNRAAAKRFRVTASGKVKHKKAYARHHAWAKNRKQKRHLRQAGVLTDVQAYKVRVLIPYVK
ncbi:MAG TPA: 50S ribosomal protein L35 [Candidatus Binataceae bacterium]|jgi:large subunit ribosomal protein L35|nr:50S ribosomal protein L35 [Candidatus Binataceae bacterium]